MSSKVGAKTVNAVLRSKRCGPMGVSKAYKKATRAQQKAQLQQDKQKSNQNNDL